MQIDTLQRKIDETQAVCRSLKQRSSSYAMQRGVLILIALLALLCALCAFTGTVSIYRRKAQGVETEDRRS